MSLSCTARSCLSRLGRPSPATARASCGCWGWPTLFVPVSVYSCNMASRLQLIDQIVHTYMYIGTLRAHRPQPTFLGPAGLGSSCPYLRPVRSVTEYMWNMGYVPQIHAHTEKSKVRDRYTISLCSTITPVIRFPARPFELSELASPCSTEYRTHIQAPPSSTFAIASYLCFPIQSQSFPLPDRALLMTWKPTSIYIPDPRSGIAQRPLLGFEHTILWSIPWTYLL